MRPNALSNHAVRTDTMIRNIYDWKLIVLINSIDNVLIVKTYAFSSIYMIATKTPEDLTRFYTITS